MEFDDEADDGHEARAFMDFQITKYQYLWETTEKQMPRIQRLQNHRNIHVDHATYRNTILKGSISAWYMTLLPAALLIYTVGSLAARNWDLSWVYLIHAVSLIVSGLMVTEMWNRYRFLMNSIRKQNLVFEPVGIWSENVTELTGDRRKYVHALLGSRALLLTLIKGTSMEFDLEDEDREIAYMIKKFIHMEELDDAIILKAENYIMRLQVLADRNMETIEMLLAIQREHEKESAEKEIQKLRKEQRKVLSWKYLTYRNPKNIYQDFNGEAI